MSVHVVVIGIPQAQARVARVSAAVVQAALPAADAGATVVEEDAKRRLQGWPAILTGDLMDSIHKEPGDLTSVDVVTDNDHAGFVEFGTSVMAAQPFMRPALEENLGPASAAAAAIFRAAVGIA